MNNKGCPRNPYTNYEFNTFCGTWPGGWVRSPDTQSIMYYNSNYYNTQTIYKGKKKYPFTYEEYQNLVENNNWMGGWIVYTDCSIQFSDISLHFGERFYIGQRQNPYYEVEFNYLIENNWQGGWVEYDNLGLYYINSDGEEGNDPMANASGIGCGSGCGSGNLEPCSGGVTSGSGTICSNNLIQVYVYWSTGYLTHAPFSNLSLGVNFSNPSYVLSAIYAYPRWTGQYGILVDGYITYKVMPSQILHEIHFLPGVYTVPQQYHTE